MYHIRNNAEFSVRNLLKDVAKRAGTNILEAVDYLDDGSPVSRPLPAEGVLLIHAGMTQIQLKVEINEQEGSAHFDFSGTGCEVRGNLNAPISVVHSAVIYCMRAMLDMDIPLNAGCLVPLTSKHHSSLLDTRINDSLNPNPYSQDPRRLSLVSITDSRCLRRKCPDVATHRRCSP